jgi:hypothetical protein
MEHLCQHCYKTATIKTKGRLMCAVCWMLREAKR